MKRFYLLVLILIVFSCSKGKNAKSSLARFVNDSIPVYLSLANEDSTSLPSRIEYTNRSFELLIREENDSLTRHLLFKVANRYYNFGDFVKYKKVSFVLKNLSLEEKDTLDLGKSYNYIGDYYFKGLQKDSALFYYLKAEKLYLGNDVPTFLPSLKLNKAIIFWQSGDYFRAESTVLDALKYQKIFKSKRQLYEAYNLLALISRDLNDYQKSIIYNKKALEIAQKYLQYDSEYFEAITLNNLGNIYQNMDNNSDAINNFRLALKQENIEQNKPNLYAALLANLAYSKFRLSKNDAAIPSLFFEAIRIQKELNNVPEIIFSNVRFAEYYNILGNSEQALILSKEALKYSDQLGNSVDKLAPLKQLSIIDPPNSSKYAAQYITIVDSLQQAERQVKDKFARIQFETDEISLQKDKLEEQNRNLLLFFVGTVMIGLLLFVIRTQRAKNRELLHKQAQQKANEDIYNLLLAQQNKIEEGRIQEKKRIAQELHDGVLGRLFGARLNLDSLNKMDGEFAEEKRNNYLSELKNIEQDIREISHDLNREKFALINNFLAILTVLLDEQANSFSPKLVVNIDDDIKWENVQNSLKINLYRIAQESLQNINKYAKANTIYFSLQEHLGNIVLTVKDDGVGFATDKKNKGIGLQNMISRVNECDGVFDVSSQKGSGTTIKIEIPIENKSITA